MRNIITIANQKGGNGKTSFVINASYELGQLDKQVLMIDFDPQATLSKNILGEDTLETYQGIEELMLNTALDPNDLIVKTSMKNLSILPCHQSLGGVPAQLIYEGEGFFTLRSVLSKINGFDYLLIDTPGSLEFLTLSSFIAADQLIIPVYPGIFSLYAVNDFLKSVALAKKNFGATIETLGVLVTIIDKRANLYKEVEQQVREFFGDKVFTETISRTVKYEEAAAKHLAVGAVFPREEIAQEYKTVCHEMLSRLGG